MIEIELTQPVSLTGPDGLLNRAAVGWAREPILNTDGIRGTNRAGLGRNKRWEYWNVMTPQHILALTVSNIDYACVNEVWVFERDLGREHGMTAVRIPARGVTIPGTLGAGPVRATGGGIDIAIDETGDGTRLRAKIDGARFDVLAHRPDGHESLAVVVPWSDKRFQYTVKDLARPATGWVQIGSHTHHLPGGESWAVLDHGRGRWPYDITWNWGAGSGLRNGRAFGIQVGGKWTDGTGSTENSMLIDGRLHKISAELDWRYDLARWREPWRITGGGLDATFTPFHNKQSRTNFGILTGATDQCFGTWSGTFTAGGTRTEFDGIEGWAEHVHNQW